MVCLPGNSFAGLFFDNWIRFTGWCMSNNIELSISRKGGSHVGVVRETCLGTRADQSLGDPTRKPWDGKHSDYDYMLWVDSDILFTHEHLEKLLSWDLDIVSGVYRLVDRNCYCVMPRHDDWPVEKMKFIDADEANKAEQKLIEIVQGGFGFTLIKKGVFESIPAPWFIGSEYILNGHKRVCTEDIYFFWKAREHGFRVYADLSCQVGHLKDIIL